MNDDPIDIFREWYELARRRSPHEHPGSVCLSTVDEKGRPDARFVDLKDFSREGFTFCTHLESRKASQLGSNAAVALTFWWPQIERQVRVSGNASPISEAQADRFFRERSREAQLATIASRQSAPTENIGLIEETVRRLDERFEAGPINRPDNWGGFTVRPIRIEYLRFRSTRAHERRLFALAGSGWRSQWLQP